MKSMKFNAILSIMIFIFFNILYSEINIDLESGMIYSGYNDVRIPGDDADHERYTGPIFRAVKKFNLHRSYIMGGKVAILRKHG